MTSFPELTGWHKAILALAAVLLLCAAAAIIFRFARKRKAARASFLLFIVFLFSAFAVLLVYVNTVVEKNKGKEQLQGRIEKANERK